MTENKWLLSGVNSPLSVSGDGGPPCRYLFWFPGSFVTLPEAATGGHPPQTEVSGGSFAGKLQIIGTAHKGKTSQLGQS